MATLIDQTAAATTPPRARSGWAWTRGEAIPLVLLALLTLLGGAMRRYHLGQQGLWFDEADIVMRARQPLPDLLRNFIHPGENGPLYTLGLACWTRLLGTSEGAVRLPSAIAGTLAIPAMYALGRTLRGPRLGLIAAALLTISPYAHWYAQDAKMYSLLVLLTIVTTWLLLAAVRRGGAAWIAYGVTAAVTLGIHATFLLVLAAHAVIAWIVWRTGYGVRPERRQMRLLGLLVGLAALPLLVWGVIFVVQNGPTWQVKATPWAILRSMLVEFSVTHKADASTQTWGVLLSVILVALGVGLTWRAGGETPLSRTAGEGSGVGAVWPSRLNLLVIVAISVIPGLLFIVLSTRRAIFEPRYLIVALPGFLLLAALGIDGLCRWRTTWLLAAAGGIAVVLLASMPLRAVNFSTTPQKEDWREAYRHLAEHARVGDGVVIYPGYLRTTYEYYAMQFPALRTLPIVTPPSLAPGTAVTDRDLNAFFTTATRGWGRAWLVESPERAPTQDPDGRVLGFYTSGIPGLQAGQTLFEERKYNGVLLDCFAYDGPFGSDRLPPQITTDLTIGATGIGLFGASLDTPGGEKRVARGTFAPLLLRWVTPKQPVREDYLALVRLVDASGTEVGRYDIAPLDGHWPTSTWIPNDDPYDPHDLFIPPTLAPGQYRILVGMAPVGDPAHPLPIFRRDGSRADTDGLVPIMTIAVT
ncbi:MAG: glycosyltransferase family 39 protein [Thermomicrobiales bacterium]